MKLDSSLFLVDFLDFLYFVAIFLVAIPFIVLGLGYIATKDLFIFWEEKMTSCSGLDKPVGLFCVKLNDGSTIYPLYMKDDGDGKYCAKLSLSFDENGDWDVFMEDIRWQKFNHYNKRNATLIMF